MSATDQLDLGKRPPLPASREFEVNRATADIRFARYIDIGRLAMREDQGSGNRLNDLLLSRLLQSVVPERTPQVGVLYGVLECAEKSAYPSTELGDRRWSRR